MFEIPGKLIVTKERVKPVLAATKSLQKAHPEFSISQFGDASVENELGGVFEKDMQKAETLSLPITLGILLLAFGALVAAGLPLLLGLTAVAGAMGLVGCRQPADPGQRLHRQRRPARRSCRRRGLLAVLHPARA